MRKTLMSLMLFVIAIGGYWLLITKPTLVTDNRPVVKVGVIYPLSGDGALYGTAAKATVEIFLEDFKKENPHYNYEFIWEDNQLKLAETVKLANKLISMDKVNVLITCLSNHGQAVSPIAEKNKVLHFSVATDPAVAKGEYNFTVATSPERESQKLVEEMLQRKVKNVDAVVMNAQGPDMIFEIFKKAAEENGIKVNQIFKSNAGERDFRMIITKINNSNPDIIMAMLQMPEVDIFMRQLKESGSHIPVTGVETFSYLKNKDLAEGMFYIDAASSTKEFAQKFKEKTGEENTAYGEYLYTILQILTKGYEESGMDRIPSHLDIADRVLSNTDQMNTAIGTITINNEGVVDSNSVIKKIENGKTIIVE